jgi:hypothetical protein
MKQRCLNKNNKRYNDYGGRGITIHGQWLDSFDHFYTDMGKRPAGYSLDRIDNDKNYEPGNCKWSTKSEQQNNKREYNSSSKSGHKGISLHRQTGHWQAAYKNKYIGLYKSIDDAIEARIRFIKASQPMNRE